MRVLFVQYTNPAIYPPLLHAMGLLAAAGCDVHAVGLDTMNADLAAGYPSGVHVRLMRAQPPGIRQKINYGQFAWRVMRDAARLRPHWLYASDALAAPAAGMARRRTGARLVYHEHDMPVEAWAARRPSVFMRQVLAARRRAIRTADLCVVPSDGRARALEAATGRRDIAVVWNCPRRDEAAAPHAPTNGAVVRFLYQGSIVPARLPPAVVEALSQVDARAQLVIAGYTTIGHPGYLEALLAHARTRGVADRVTYAGVLNRTALLDLAAGSDVGLALFPIDTTDPNESTMVGASNKAFEYLARGLPLIVSDRPEWREAFTGRELARPCDPARAESVAAALRWFVERPAERWAMGERGRQRVLAGWNYETTFAPVLETLVGGPPKAAADR